MPVSEYFILLEKENGVIEPVFDILGTKGF